MGVQLVNVVHVELVSFGLFLKFCDPLLKLLGLLFKQLVLLLKLLGLLNQLCSLTNNGLLSISRLMSGSLVTLGRSWLKVGEALLVAMFSLGRACSHFEKAFLSNTDTPSLMM